MNFFGDFSWPKFVEVFPVYVGAIAALAAVFVAWKQLGIMARHEAERDALHNLDRVSYSSDWQTQRRTFLKLKSKLQNGEIESATFAKRLLTRLDTGAFEEEIQSFRIMMNHYEVIAIGIESGSYSDPIYRKFLRGQFKKDWQAMFPTIVEMRRLEGNPLIYIEAQQLAVRWNIEFPYPIADAQS